MKENVHSITGHNNSKLQLFLSVYHIELQVHQFQRYIDNLENDERANAVDITMKQNDEIENIFSKLKSITALGEVMVVKTAIDLKRETAIKRKAQEESRDQSTINQMKMNIETKIEINMVYYMSDMICLMDGRVIVVDGDGKVVLLTPDGKLQKKLPIPGKAWSVTQTNHSTIAISYPGAGIKIVSLKEEKVTKSIELDKTYRGISFSNSSLAVGFNNNEIRIIDLEGNTQKAIQVNSKSYLYNIVYHNDRIIFSDSRGKAVTYIDESGKQIWQYKKNLSGPEGLLKDAYGNIIVADPGSNRILVISNNRQDSKVLISKDDGLKNHMCVCFKQNESSGYICESGTYLAKFNISYG